MREARRQARTALLRVLGAKPLAAMTRPLRPQGDVILCLHNVVENHGVLGVNRGLDLTAGELNAILDCLLEEGYRPVPLHDLCPQVTPLPRPGEKRVAITFDDGYAGNLHVAFPVLRRRNVPFTVYVTTGFMDRAVRVWWYALERLIGEAEHIGFAHAGREYRFATIALSHKVHTYRCVRGLLLTAQPDAVERILQQLFAERVADLSELGAGDVLSVEQVQALSRDPLVTIGAHSISHPALRQLDEDSCRQEIRGSRERLMAVTRSPVDHFAYPFGNRAAYGPREEQLAQESGYKTAATTCARQLESTDRPTALPRIMLTAELDVLTGLRALLTGWFGRRD